MSGFIQLPGVLRLLIPSIYTGVPLSQLNIALFMFPILDLPNELLRRIVYLVQCSDLVPFALSCRTIHICCGVALRKRLALKKYSTLAFGGFDLTHRKIVDLIGSKGSRHCDAKDNALLLLGSILEEPDMACWPGSIRIGSYCDEVEPLIDQDELTGEKMQQVVARHSTGLRKIIDECIFIPEIEKESTFESLCKPTGEVVAVRLLLTLLPNLQSIAFEGNSRRLPMLARAVERIAIANRDPTSPSHSKALVHLSKISMKSLDEDEESGECPCIYGPFAMLPSLKTVRGCQIDGASFTWPHSFHDQTSNVTEIDIRYSAVSSAAFSGLISGISALKNFTYHHAGFIVGDEHYDPAGIMEALRQHSAHSLVSVDMTADQEELYGGEEEDQHVGSLRIFQVLMDVRLEEMAFHFRIRDPLDNINVQALMDEQFYEDEVLTEKDDEDSTEEKEWEDGWERLVDILPASVQTFQLRQYSDSRVIRELFEGMAIQREKLPALNTIRFEHGYDDPLESDMVTELKDAGLVLKSWYRTM